MKPPSINPIIPGFAPDPSICLIGDTFFLVNSSFHIFPGLPTYVSRNLISWKHIGNAINRSSQLSLLHATTIFHPGDHGDTILATGGLYAPTIRHHKGVTYILCTNVIHSSKSTPPDERNFIIKTTDPFSGNWSDPVYYSFRGIDPSILFDDDGRVYVQGTSNDFQIYNMEIDLDTGHNITEPCIIWTGWDSRFTEGPHIYKRGGWYYLMCAEGGTFDCHLVSMARSMSVWGPYQSCPRNPLCTASGTENYVQNTGHADLFQDTRQRWWAVMLGVRRAAGGRYALGRESFLTQVEWAEGDWPVIQPIKMMATQIPGYAPSSSEDIEQREPLNLAVNGVDLVYLRDPHLSLYEISYADSNNGSVSVNKISIKATPIELTSPRETVSFVGKRQRLIDGTSSVILCVYQQKKNRNATGLSSQAETLRAGIAVYKDEHRFMEMAYHFGLQKVTLKAQNTVKKYAHSIEKHLVERDIGDLVFRVEYTEEAYLFSFKFEYDSSWTRLGKVDTLQLTGYDFTGPLIGIFAVGPDNPTVKFKDFRVDNADMTSP